MTADNFADGASVKRGPQSFPNAIIGNSSFKMNQFLACPKDSFGGACRNDSRRWFLHSLDAFGRRISSGR